MMSRIVLLAWGLALAAAKPTCCWSKWGDASSCGNYDASSGSQCNTDHSKQCNSDSDCPTTPAPAPTPAPPAPPSPPSPPSPPAPPSAQVLGYWSLTWSQTDAPKGANMGIAFSGWNDPARAQNESAPVQSKLAGAKWIDAGGGNKNGRWSADFLAKWASVIKSGGLKGWDGIVFDVEECYASGLADDFAAVLKAAKAANLKTLVTTSHSAPYMCNDAKDLMQSFFTSSDVDYLSPQLYSSGEEATPSFDAGNGVKWTDWVGAKGRFVPSLSCACVKNGGYAKTQEYFSKLNIETSGYIVWPSRGCSLSEISSGAVIV